MTRTVPLLDCASTGLCLYWTVLRDHSVQMLPTEKPDRIGRPMLSKEMDPEMESLFGQN